MTDNARAALLMTVAMGFFALEDAFIKTLTASLPVPQLLAMTGAAGMCAFWLRMARRRKPLFTRALLHPMVLARNAGELVGAFGFVTALAWGDLAVASAILQVLPLTLVMGGALVLGERVGWRRWLSVAVGFAGVLLILRPGAAGIEASALLAVLAVAGLTLRDLATRRIPAGVPSDQLSASAFGVMAPAGLLLVLAGGGGLVVPSPLLLALLAAAVLLGVLGYGALVAASRLGEASVVAPFRYTRLAFALLVAALVFGERPDGLTLAGAGLIAAAGAYAMWREARQSRASAAPGPVDGLVRPSDR